MLPGTRTPFSWNTSRPRVPRLCQPYLLILPGGGWNRQWGFIEGQASAARASALGYPAFVLYYRVKQEPVGLLSGGQRQALTLLMATYHIPKLLLLDEHTAALDPGTAEKVLALTRSIVEENKSPASRSPTTCSPPWIWATAR